MKKFIQKLKEALTPRRSRYFIIFFVMHVKGEIDIRYGTITMYTDGYVPFLIHDKCVEAVKNSFVDVTGVTITNFIEVSKKELETWNHGKAKINYNK